MTLAGRRVFSGRARGAVFAPLLCAALACAAPARRLGPTPEEAARRADALLESLALHVGPTRYDGAYEQIRARLARAALVPSRAFEDASLWTAGGEGLRELEIRARSGPDGVPVMAVEAAAPAPTSPGDYRARIRLRRLGGSEYEWDVADEVALGPARPDDLLGALGALLAALADLPRNEAAARLRRDMPATAAAFAGAVRLEELSVVPAPGDSAFVTLRTRLHPERLAAEFPRYAKYIEKYTLPARLRLDLLDGGGGRWGELASGRGETVFRFRVREGGLAGFSGGTPPLPGRLRLRADVSVKGGLFRVGVRGLEAEVTTARGRGRVGVEARFAREPEWDLPFLVEPLLRSSLRRPFEAGGARLALGLEEAGSGPTQLRVEYRAAVRESWVVRWLNALVGTAVGEFRGGAEEEADRFHARVLQAVRTDVAALLGSPPPSVPRQR